MARLEGRRIQKSVVTSVGTLNLVLLGISSLCLVSIFFLRSLVRSPTGEEAETEWRTGHQVLLEVEQLAFRAGSPHVLLQQSLPEGVEADALQRTQHKLPHEAKQPQQQQNTQQQQENLQAEEQPQEGERRQESQVQQLMDGKSGGLRGAAAATPPGLLTERPRGNAISDSTVHVCFSTDDLDLRPLVVAINSSIINSKSPRRFVFHILTSSEWATIMAQRVRDTLNLDNRTLMVHHDDDLQAHIKKLIHFRKSSQARKGLANVFNFVPFYSHEYIAKDGIHVDRIIYVDSDVVVQGDLATLCDLDLEGNPVAAVEDSVQKLELYIDFKELKRQGLLTRDGRLDRQSPVFNRGIFVMDVKLWKNMNITSSIEYWMTKYRDSQKDLYFFGMSQPPWLLALTRRYRALEPAWNCKGLGREAMSSEEFRDLKVSMKLDDAGAKALGFKASLMKPYMAPCAATAKLLHFTGALKPWKNNTWQDKRRPRCLKPGILTHGDAPDATIMKKDNLVSCARIWTQYLNPELAERLVPKPRPSAPA
eukprot:CAMPEP_0206533672 /NCGR_PEP_ID=MMETSP0325_2-20121206/5098_1 /ASSEMBLY_ACC=CAM_ASM_000347 /TAXON_ID=2866 /ORGANISM="Crypthecodinium cohnii, Strain Seligo" /LENGTH=535 /DNA_ID=CAMNT_0054030347 /DNA_START=44 /DNA_END=1651 /DNA_ORIENTATION=+